MSKEIVLCVCVSTRALESSASPVLMCPPTTQDSGMEWTVVGEILHCQQLAGDTVVSGLSNTVSEILEHEAVTI